MMHHVSVQNNGYDDLAHILPIALLLHYLEYVRLRVVLHQVVERRHVSVLQHRAVVVLHGQVVPRRHKKRVGHPRVVQVVAYCAHKHGELLHGGKCHALVNVHQNAEKSLGHVHAMVEVVVGIIVVQRVHFLQENPEAVHGHHVQHAQLVKHVIYAQVHLRAGKREGVKVPRVDGARTHFGEALVVVGEQEKQLSEVILLKRPQHGLGGSAVRAVPRREHLLVCRAVFIRRLVSMLPFFALRLHGLLSALGAVSVHAKQPRLRLSVHFVAVLVNHRLHGAPSSFPRHLLHQRLHFGHGVLHLQHRQVQVKVTHNMRGVLLDHRKYAF
mmetsp:Transcript_32529/g.62491  ORF Transcript_32529/g.62491 Transcript_32529/m.62491 type:complete len:327 (-) Transcript_32529:1718-2698(-)